MKLLLGVFLLLYALALLQMSFFVHFFPSGLIPNFIIATVLLASIFERSESHIVSQGSALFGGLLIDIFSDGVIGLWAGILFVASILIKIILEDYVRLPIPKKF